MYWTLYGAARNTLRDQIKQEKVPIKASNEDHTGYIAFDSSNPLQIWDHDDLEKDDGTQAEPTSNAEAQYNIENRNNDTKITTWAITQRNVPGDQVQDKCDILEEQGVATRSFEEEINFFEIPFWWINTHSFATLQQIVTWWSQTALSRIFSRLWCPKERGRLESIPRTVPKNWSSHQGQ